MRSTLSIERPAPTFCRSCPKVLGSSKATSSSDWMIPTLQTQKIQQQIVCSNSESAVIEAEAAIRFSQARTWTNTTKARFRSSSSSSMSAVFVARKRTCDVRKSIFVYSKRLASRGYVPEAQLEADAFAVEKARKELNVAETKLDVMKTYTREKMLTQLRAAIKTAKARLAAKKQDVGTRQNSIEVLRRPDCEKCNIRRTRSQWPSRVRQSPDPQQQRPS